LAFGDFPSLRTHFWPFTDVLRKIWHGVTRKNAEDSRTADVTDERLLKSIRRLGRLAKDNWANSRQPKMRGRSDAATAGRRLAINRPYLFTISFGASEATIFSKHGSPRKGSQNGISFNSP